MGVSKLSPLKRGHRKPFVIDEKDPRGLAECDGCGFWVQHADLRQQVEYRGGLTPVGTGFYVCDTCFDVPQMQPGYMKIVLPPDPVPLPNPRVPNYSLNSDNMIFLITGVNGEYLITNADGPTFLMAQNPGI